MEVGIFDAYIVADKGSQIGERRKLIFVPKNTNLAAGFLIFAWYDGLEPAHSEANAEWINLTPEEELNFLAMVAPKEIKKPRKKKNENL